MWVWVLLVLVAGHWWLLWVVFLPVPVGSFLGGAPRRGWMGLVVYFGGVGGVLSLPGVVPVVAVNPFCLPGVYLWCLVRGSVPLPAAPPVTQIAALSHCCCCSARSLRRACKARVAHASSDSNTCRVSKLPQLLF